MSSLPQATLCASCGFPSIGRSEIYPSLSAQALHSWNALSVDGIQDCRETMSEIQTELSRIDSEMVQVQVVLDHLASERQRLHGSLNQCRLVMAPIRRLPTEILSEIFRTLPRGPEVEASISNSPLLLTQVCSRWRDVAISTPQLWGCHPFLHP